MRRIRLARAVPVVLLALAACGPSAAGGKPPTTPVAPATAGRLAAASPMALAGAGTEVFYADLEGVWAVPVAGGDARRVTDTTKLVERLVPHGDRLYLGLEGQIAWVPIVGGAPRIVHTGAVAAFTVDDDGLWLLDDAGLHVAPLDGGAARTVTGPLGDPGATLTTDATTVFLTTVSDLGEAPPLQEDVAPNAIWRVAKRDGTHIRLARRQYGVTGLALRGDRLYWSSFGAGLRSLPAVGGTIRTELGGGGAGFAADGDGVVVLTTSGLFVESRGATSEVAPVAPDRAPERQPGFILVGGAIVALVTDPLTSASSLWRLPRPWGSGVTVAGWVTDRASELRVVPDGLVVLDAPLDEAAPTRILHLDPQGKRRVMVSAPGIDQLAVDGATVAYRAGGALWRIDGTAAPTRVVELPADEAVLGLTLAGDTLYWSDTGVVRSAPARGGAITTAHDPIERTGGSGPPRASIVVDGETVYFNALGWQSLGVRRVTGPETSDLLFDGPPDGGYVGDDMVRAGEALYVAVGEDQVWKVPLDGAAPALAIGELPQTPVDMVAIGDRLAAQIWDDAGPAIVVLDPAAGSVTSLFRLGDEGYARLAGAPDGAAIYAGLGVSDLIIRVPVPRR